MHVSLYVRMSDGYRSVLKYAAGKLLDNNRPVPQILSAERTKGTLPYLQDQSRYFVATYLILRQLVQQTLDLPRFLRVLVRWCTYGKQTFHIFAAKNLIHRC